MPSEIDQQRPDSEAVAALTTGIVSYPPGTDAQRLARVLERGVDAAWRDEREMAVAGHFFDSVSGLVPEERLGPFRTREGADVVIDVFAAA